LESQRLAGSVLVRIAIEGCDDAVLSRDLAPLLNLKCAPDVWRIELSRLISAFVAGGLAERNGTRLEATATGLAAAADFLGVRRGLPATWETARDTYLIAKALDMSAPSMTRLRALRKPEGLRAMIVEHHFQLRIKGVPNAPRVRSALAVLALERAFGNRVEAGAGGKSALPAKAARSLAAKLSTSGREFGTDGRLVAALASEALKTRRSDLASLQTALLRQYLGRSETDGDSRLSGRNRRRLRRGANNLPELRVDTDSLTAPGLTAEIAAVDSGTEALPAPAPVDTERPDPIRFAEAVLVAASEAAEGWAGNRKAFISKVWALVQARHSGWALTDIEFKCMLTEAHRTGLIALANADLKDKRALKDLEDSAVVYKNTVWHYVRTAD
jgi:hypothetical protein